MRKIISIILVLITVVSFSSMAIGASWGPSVKTYNKSKEIDIMRWFIDGLGRGFFVANVYVRMETKARLFCVPENLALEIENYIRILDDEIKRREESQGFEKVQEDPIDLLLLEGLKRTFPCR